MLWQEGFHDWLCMSREMIDSVERYIEYNARIIELADKAAYALPGEIKWLK